MNRNAPEAFGRFSSITYQFQGICWIGYRAPAHGQAPAGNRIMLIGKSLAP
jgi:hypothetical protein